MRSAHEVQMRAARTLIATEVVEAQKTVPARLGDPSAPGSGSGSGSTLGPAGRPLPSDTDALLYPAEAAHLLALSSRTLEGWRLRGGGPPFVRLNRAVRYRRADVLAWIETRLFDSTSGADEPIR
jgi:predicted DNA-binding transcriptional regulator AlpA